MFDILVAVVEDAKGNKSIVIDGDEYDKNSEEIVIGFFNIFRSVTFKIVTPDYVFPRQPIALQDAVSNVKPTSGWNWNQVLKQWSKFSFILPFPKKGKKERVDWFNLRVEPVGGGDPVFLDPKIKNGQPGLELVVAGAVVLAVAALGLWMFFAKT